MDLSSPQQRLDYFKARFKRAKATSDLWMALLNKAYDYAIPNRNLFYWTSQTQGTQKNAKVYDTTLPAATNAFVSKVHGALTPPNQTWAKLTAGMNIGEDHPQRQEIDEALQSYTDKLFNYIQHSNFDMAINECYYDLAIGTLVLCVNEGDCDDKPFHFYSVPLARVAMEQSNDTHIKSVYRWWDEMSIADVMHRWPNAILPNSVWSLYNVDPTAVLKNLIEATIFRPEIAREWELMPPDKDGNKPPCMCYTYCLWHNEALLLEEESDSTPWIVARWKKISNEIFGRGVVIDSLPSALSLNEIARIELAAANFNICKPYMAFGDSIFQPWTFNLQPNTIISVGPVSNGVWPIQPMPDVANPAFAQLIMNDLRMQINTLMYNQPLGPVEGPDKTAYEQALRSRSFAEEVGPAFTRMQQEFLPKLIDRMLWILRKRGLMDPFKIDGKEVRLTYQSPMMYAQGQQDVQAVQGTMQFLQGTVGPETAMIYIDPSKIHLWAAEKLGADLSIFNSQEEMQKKFNAANQEQASVKQMQMQAMQQQLAAGAQ